jgi:hypothetical protein
MIDLTADLTGDMMVDKEDLLLLIEGFGSYAEF